MTDGLVWLWLNEKLITEHGGKKKHDGLSADDEAMLNEHERFEFMHMLRAFLKRGVFLVNCIG